MKKKMVYLSLFDYFQTTRTILPDSQAVYLQGARSNIAKRWASVPHVLPTTGAPTDIYVVSFDYWVSYLQDLTILTYPLSTYEIHMLIQFCVFSLWLTLNCYPVNPPFPSILLHFLKVWVNVIPINSWSRRWRSFSATTIDPKLVQTLYNNFSQLQPKLWADLFEENHIYGRSSFGPYWYWPIEHRTRSSYSIGPNFSSLYFFTLVWMFSK